jgi:hypothetical protein
VESGTGIFSSFCFLKNRENTTFLQASRQPQVIHAAPGVRGLGFSLLWLPPEVFVTSEPLATSEAADGGERGRGWRKKNFAKQTFTNNMNYEKLLGLDNFR